MQEIKLHTRTIPKKRIVRARLNPGNPVHKIQLDADETQEFILRALVFIAEKDPCLLLEAIIEHDAAVLKYIVRRMKWAEFDLGGRKRNVPFIRLTALGRQELAHRLSGYPYEPGETGGFLLHATGPPPHMKPPAQGVRPAPLGMGTKAGFR